MTFHTHEGHGARSDSVHRHIFRSHLAYLNQEETPAKLEQRHNLENIISSFLSMVPHSEKFSFYELSDILGNSIDKNPNFSAYKAGSAFEALEKYATNLISHPWRKEYKTVKLYSGFYKHFIEQQLLGGSAVFNLLGYRYENEGVLSLDEPVDPDKAARVALDCLTAYVECQIMVQICERVKSYKCSWSEIYGIRHDYSCGVDEAVRILHQLKRNAGEQERQDRWYRNYENGIKEDKLPLKQEPSSYHKTGILVDVSNSWSNNSFQDYHNDSFSPQSSLVSNSHLNKTTKLSNSKHPSLSCMSSQPAEYQGRNFTSKSDEADRSYKDDSLDEHLKANYNSFCKSNNICSRIPDSDLTPDSWKDSWELLNPLQSSSYPIRHDSYNNCDRDSHKLGYNSVPNAKEAYNSHFGHLFPAHPLMSFESPSYPYPVSHEFGVSPRQCQSRTCCEHQLSAAANKYQQKDSCPNHCESNRSYSGTEMSYPNDSNGMSSSFVKLSLDGHSNSNSKIRHFSSGSNAYPSYQMQVDSLNDVTFRPTNGSKFQQTASKRESYYDNVPSFESDASPSFTATGTSLTSKCDFQANGTAILNSATIKPKSQKGSVTLEGGNSLTLKHPPRKNLVASCSLVGASEITSDSSLMDSKNPKSHLTVSRKDSKGNKKWSCSSCTFYNAAEKSICDMCGRSKNPGPEVAPLVSGGRECPQCTLVNKKDSEDCTACGTSLKDSPTYI